MPTDVLKVSGDYLLDAGQGDVTINVTNSISTGTVTILGNLNVVGTSAQIQSTDSVLTDNIIVLNDGETADPGITKGYSGILISRGYNADPTIAASILYNESPNGGYWNNPAGDSYDVPGIFEFTSNGQGSAIRVNAIRIDVNSTSTLNLLGVEGGSDAMVNVRGQTDYALRVIDPNDIPNKAYVDNALYAGTDLAKRIQVGNSFMRVADNSITPGDPYWGVTNRIFAALGTDTNVVFDLYGTSLSLSGITIDGSELIAKDVNDIVLQPQSGSAVVIKETLKLGQRTTSTTVVPDGNLDTIYYSETVGGGGTGLYYVNTNQSDELVSRRKAIIYGIIF